MRAMCEYVDSKNIIAGWSCHACRLYNGLQRKFCRGCMSARCEPLLGDCETGRSFETYEAAYAQDPQTLALVQAQLARQA